MKSNLSLCIPLLAFLFFVSCDDKRQAPVGVESLEELVTIAENVHSTGDHNVFLKHTDLSGIPNKKKEGIIETLRQGGGLSKNLTNDSVSVIEPSELNSHRQRPEWMDDEMRAAFDSAMIWNIKPDKIILFKNSSKSEAGTYSTYWFGAFQRNELWYFAAQYNKH